MRLTGVRGGVRPVGSTLPELIVSFGILVPVVVVAIGIFPFSHVLNRQAWDRAAAYDVGRSQLETLRAIDFDDLAYSYTPTKITRNDTEYTVTASTSTYGTQDPVILKKLTVVVTWVSNHKSEELRLESLVAKTQE